MGDHKYRHPRFAPQLGNPCISLQIPGSSAPKFIKQQYARLHDEKAQVAGAASAGELRRIFIQRVPQAFSSIPLRPFARRVSCRQTAGQTA